MKVFLDQEPLEVEVALADGVLQDLALVGVDNRREGSDFTQSWKKNVGDPILKTNLLQRMT